MACCSVEIQELVASVVVSLVVGMRLPVVDPSRQFLGFIGYYRKFVKDFSKITRPLTDLMPVPKKTKRCRAKLLTTTSWILGQQQEDAFQQLKRQLQKPPILGFPQYNKPFELYTNAFMLGLGGCTVRSMML
jgi:hypothetical protein